MTIDEPEDPTRPIPPSEVAAVTSAMLREIKPLAGAGDIVAGDSADPRRRVAVQVLRIASDYDDFTARDGTEASIAIETLRSAPGYVYDEKVLPRSSGYGDSVAPAVAVQVRVVPTDRAFRRPAYSAWFDFERTSGSRATRGGRGSAPRPSRPAER